MTPKQKEKMEQAAVAEQLKATALLEQFQQAQSRRIPWENHWKQAYDYTIPQRSVSSGSLSVGGSRVDNLFDATAADGAEQLAASLLAQLTPPGGLTNQGIATETFYEPFRKQNPQMNLPEDVRELTDDEITAIYRHEFFERTKLNKFFAETNIYKEYPEFANHVFDVTVNRGANKGIKTIQKAIDNVMGTDLRETNLRGQKYYDGNIGPKTRKAVIDAIKKGKIAEINNDMIRQRYEIYQNQDDVRKKNNRGLPLRFERLRMDEK